MDTQSIKILHNLQLLVSYYQSYQICISVHLLMYLFHSFPKIIWKKGGKVLAHKEKLSRKVKKRQVYTENYEVEKIVDKRIMLGQIEYLVKWKGWGIEDNTWEPQEHLEEVHTLIDVFERLRVRLRADRLGQDLHHGGRPRHRGGPRPVRRHPQDHPADLRYQAEASGEELGLQVACKLTLNHNFP